jgi:putative ABC transport system permease protein
MDLKYLFFTAIFTGFLVGSFVGFIQRDNKITGILAGILALFMLQGLNLIIMEKPNISLLEITLQYFYIYTFILLLILCFAIFFYTNAGLVFEAFGNNKLLLSKLGFNINLIRCFGLGLSNALSSISGALSACSFGYADVGMGQGVTILSLGMVMIGTQYSNFLFENTTNVNKDIIGITLGIVSYFLVLQLLLYFEINTLYLKLTMGLALIGIFSIKKPERSLL